MAEFDLTYEMVVEYAERAVGQMGEGYVYPLFASPPSCRYATYDPKLGAVGDPVPSCIVGHILHSAGLNMWEFIHDGTSGGRYSVGAAYKVLDNLQRDGRISLGADKFKIEVFLGFLQGCQDNGAPWGTALQSALNEVERIMSE